MEALQNRVIFGDPVDGDDLVLPRPDLAPLADEPQVSKGKTKGIFEKPKDRRKEETLRELRAIRENLIKDSINRRREQK